MADIAFLLLIFFLVVTTIDIDSGIGLRLPPIPEEDIPPPQINDRNILNINVNPSGFILMDEEQVGVTEVQDRVIEFIDNPNNDPNLSVSPQDAIVSIKSARQTSYNAYIGMLDEVVGAYATLRDRASQEQYGVPFSALQDGSLEQDTIEDMYPKAISFAEPDEG